MCNFWLFKIALYTSIRKVTVRNLIKSLLLWSSTFLCVSWDTTQPLTADDFPRKTFCDFLMRNNHFVTPCKEVTRQRILRTFIQRPCRKAIFCSTSPVVGFCFGCSWQRKGQQKDKNSSEMKQRQRVWERSSAVSNRIAAWSSENKENCQSFVSVCVPFHKHWRLMPQDKLSAVYSSE